MRPNPCSLRTSLEAWELFTTLKQVQGYCGRYDDAYDSLYSKAQQSTAKHSKAQQCNAMQSNAKQCKAKQSSAKQCKAMQSKAKQCKAMQSSAKQSKAMQSNAKQRNTTQSNAKQRKATENNAKRMGTRIMKHNAYSCKTNWMTWWKSIVETWACPSIAQYCHKGLALHSGFSAFLNKMWTGHGGPCWKLRGIWYCHQETANFCTKKQTRIIGINMFTCYLTCDAFNKITTPLPPCMPCAGFKMTKAAQVLSLLKSFPNRRLFSSAYSAFELCQKNAKLAGNTSTQTEQQNTPILSDHFDGFQSCTPFPQMAKLLGFLLQVPDELDMCVLERACWCVGAGHYCQRAVCILTTWCCYRVLLPECGVRYKLGCWCRCREWLQDVHGSVDVAPWWRLGE